MLGALRNAQLVELELDEYEPFLVTDNASLWASCAALRALGLSGWGPIDVELAAILQSLPPAKLTTLDLALSVSLETASFASADMMHTLTVAPESLKALELLIPPDFDEDKWSELSKDERDSLASEITEAVGMAKERGINLKFKRLRTQQAFELDRDASDSDTNTDADSDSDFQKVSWRDAQEETN